MIGAIGGHTFRTRIGLVRHIMGDSDEGEKVARKARHSLSDCSVTFILAPSSLLVLILRETAVDGGTMKVIGILFTLLYLGALGGCYIDPGPPASGGYYSGDGRYQGEYRAYERRATEDERREYWQQRRREREYWDRQNASPGPSPYIPPPPPGPPPPPPPDLRR